MKTNCWLILGTMIAAGAIAQDTNALPPIPAPVTSPAAEVAPAPAAVDTSAPVAAPVKHKRHAVLKKLVEPTVTLVPGPAEVAVTNLNVRGQAGLKGEFIAHITKGDAVTVLDQINLDKHKADEPAQWAKIALPASVKVWVRTQFVDATNKVVLPKKLNLRAGPGENYSVLGVLERGTSVSEIITKDDWMQIEAPTNAYAFVAAMYLNQASSGNLVAMNTQSTEVETDAGHDDQQRSRIATHLDRADNKRRDRNLLTPMLPLPHQLLTQTRHRRLTTRRPRRAS